MILTIFVAFFVLLLIGVPVAMAIGAAAMGAFWLDGTFPMAQVPHKMVNGVYSFPLVAVPLFILAGALAGETSIAARLVRLATALVGHIRGGLGHVNVASSMFFGGVSGSAVADTAAVGSLMIPAMEKQGYSREDAGAITITSSTIGILIPPSIPMVLYGVTVGTSVGALFLAGLVPGILVGLLLMVAVYVMAKRKGWPQAERRAPASELWAAFKDAILALLLPVFLLGAIVTGLTTATEAGVIGVVYALFLAGVVYREFSFRQLGTIVVEAAVNTAIPLFVVATTSVVAWVVAIEQFPDSLVGFFNGLDASPWVVLILINLFLVVIGMFVDLVPALILFAPILLPVAVAQGVDPVQFGAIMVVNLGVGLVTPPVGNCLYVGAAVAKVPVGRLVRASLPFLLINFLTLLLVTFVPWISLFLPSLFY
ncbi:MAG: TRAP transporter large permease [Sagittula sp.]|jgi:C4-dicarboxylate transporter DctM subunit|uniref:TRAP transporter large permease n=1 Tax=unclassified Sagittula TaxID=2624628 RepID=UPI000C2D2C93|nr:MULTISPECIES: TRAP transporter large permease [unclassified Sagittula]AUC56194.1 C4-dicarboxylate ABC transporter permease [Sagittula sp. P11]WHZ38089.1 TRAP transporter large permease [Sagittula sp. MA-2]